MEFREIEIADRDLVRGMLKADPQEISDASFSYQFAHAKAVHTFSRICESHGCIFYRWGTERCCRYSFPIGGGDKGLALAELREHCRSLGDRMVLSEVTAASVESIRRILPGDWEVEAERDEFDYVYDCAALSLLAGRRYQNRRQMIHRFEELGPWTYSDIGVGDIGDCVEIAAKWNRVRLEGAKADDPCIHDDIAATARMLEGFVDSGMFGGILRQNGEPVAFAMGEALTANMVLLTFERSVPSVKGAAAMLNREFVRKHCRGYGELNRACDAGDLGLRKVKLKYRPSRMVEKFLVSESRGGVR